MAPTTVFQMDTSGVITGFAWSDNIGWIQAGGLSGFPSGSGTVSGNAQLTSTSNITGWLKALSGGTPPDSQNGGWDGWISLGGTSPAYGITRNSATGDLSGYAWGDTIVGWVSFAFGKCSNTCTPSTLYTCSGQTVVRTDTSATCNVTTTNGPVCNPTAWQFLLTRFIHLYSDATFIHSLGHPHRTPPDISEARARGRHDAGVLEHR